MYEYERQLRERKGTYRLQPQGVIRVLVLKLLLLLEGAEGQRVVDLKGS